MSYSDTPTSVRSLEQRIRNIEGGDGLALRRRVAMALVVVGQMLPEGAIKGGSAMALRYGRGTRFTQDLDAARVQPLARFRSDFEDALATGWAGFTGRLVEKAAARPPAVPTAYVMQPFEVKLAYRGRPWCTVKFELGHNEIGDADEPEHLLASDLADLFTEVGLEEPRPVPVMRADHQVAQKLHAASQEDSERARDLVDLQLLENGEDLDLVQVRMTCVRLFEYRHQQHWPPTVAVGEGWDTLYEAAVEDVGVLPDVETAAAWVNASTSPRSHRHDDRRREDRARQAGDPPGHAARPPVGGGRHPRWARRRAGGEHPPPVTADTIREWCGRPGVTVVVKPMIDLADHVHVDAYEVPDRIAEPVALRDHTCVFPWCTRPARNLVPDDHHHGCDHDHVVPYARGGPTCSCSIASLCRRHHRLKTHGAWRYLVLEPGSYVWTSPHGYQFLCDHLGTADVTADVTPDLGTDRRMVPPATGHP